MKNSTPESSPQPQILIFDIENTTHVGEFWGRDYEVSIVKIDDYGQILCYSAKWLGKKAFVRGWIDTKNEKNLVKEIRELFDKADIIIAHNGKNHDIKWCNSRFLHYGLSLPSPYKVLDTKIEAKKHLNLPSYRLNSIADYFGLGHKIEHEGYSLWEKCVLGDKAAWKRMKSYNKRDVDLLERVYLELRPLMDNHPLGRYSGKEVCEACGGTRFQSRGLTFRNGKPFHRIQCLKCGHWNYRK